MVRNKHHIAINLGTLLEYYDFVIFSMLAKSMIEALFPEFKINSALLHFLFFSLGGIFRFIGGIGFGLLGDFFGRRSTFIYMTLLMSTATIFIGLFPSINNANITLFFLFILRALQSISFGGEISGASTFVYETGTKTQRGVFLGFVFSGASIGAVFATITLSFLTFYITSEEISSWGWRIPFVLGGILGFCTFFLRKSLQETEDFISTSENPHKKLTILRRNISSIVHGVSVFIFPLTLVMLNIYFSFYFSTYFKLSLNLIYTSQTIGLIAAILIAPLSGLLLKKITAQRLLLGGILIFISIIYFMADHLLQRATYLSLGMFFVLWQLLSTSIMVWSMSYTLNLFPVEIRATGIGIVYNLSAMLSGFVPTFITSIYDYFNTPYIAFLILMAVGSISITSLLFQHKKLI